MRVNGRAGKRGRNNELVGERNLKERGRKRERVSESETARAR